MVDTKVSKTFGRKSMWVRLPPSALFSGSGVCHQILKKWHRQGEVLSEAVRQFAYSELKDFLTPTFGTNFLA
jgi:hypothetical protein